MGEERAIDGIYCIHEGKLYVLNKPDSLQLSVSLSHLSLG